MRPTEPNNAELKERLGKRLNYILGFHEGRMEQLREIIQIISRRRFLQLDLSEAFSSIQRLPILEQLCLDLYDLHTIEEWQAHLHDAIQLSLNSQTRNSSL